ncbi:PQQ-binding-like beta-propeller repeat protein, partial [bacterium]|nr:PQQ-binding-like beta-propeller repeat protein [bacterium]
LRASRAALRHAPDRSSPPLLLRVAALCEKLRRWREAVDACQQVLAAPHVPEASWRAARLQVARILTSQGPKPYAQHEAAATALLGRDAADALEQLVRAYPNSTSAPTALLRLAAQANAKKQSGAARAWLHRLARDYPASPLAPSAIYRLAVGHAGEGGAAMARGALHTLRVRHPDWKGVHAGQAVTARVEADAFLGAHLPPDAATLSPVPAPPFRIDWVAKQEYGSSELYVRGDEGADPKAIYFLLGISLESRSVRDGSLLWADRPGWLGISILDALLPEGGVRVGEVIPNTPAERAGFRVGDILTHFNRVPLRNTQQLIARCTALRAGSSVTASFLREGKKQEVKVVLGERPTQAGRFHLQPNSFAGLSAGNILIRRQAALDAIRVRDGHRVWSYPLGDVVDFQGPAEHHLTASAPGILVAALESGRLLAADPANGRHLWTARIEEPTVHALALWEHGLVVASSRPCAIRVLNPFTGDVLFEDTAPRAVSVPVFALDTQPVLCYAIGSRIACLRPGAQAPDWSVRAEGLHVERVLLAETTLVVQGTDDRGVPTFHAHRLTDGAATWRLPLLAGESLVAASLEAGALYLSTHRGAAGRIRRVDAAAGRLVWSKDLARDQEAAAWNTDGATLTLGLTRTADTGRRRAEVLVLDKRSGADLQRLELGDGKLSSLVRIGPAFYAVIEGAAARAFAQGRVFAAAIESARFHVVRIVTTR